MAAEEFCCCLENLTNRESEIFHLTKLAIDNKEFAPSIFQIIYSHYQTVSSAKKLPCLFLIDSIIKSKHSETYVDLFTPHITEIFSTVFLKADKHTRATLFRVRQNWCGKFPMSSLHELDLQVRKLDPGWPVARNLDSTSVKLQDHSKRTKSNAKPSKRNVEVPKSCNTSPEPVPSFLGKILADQARTHNIKGKQSYKSLSDIPKPYLPPVRRVPMSQFYWAASQVFMKPLSERKQVYFPKQHHFEADKVAEEIFQPAKRRKVEHELPPASHSVASLQKINPNPLHIKSSLLIKESAYLYEKKLPKFQKISMVRHFAMCNYARIEYHKRQQAAGLYRRRFLIVLIGLR